MYSNSKAIKLRLQTLNTCDLYEHKASVNPNRYSDSVCAVIN